MYCLEAGRLEGRFAMPPSKPMAQRLLLASALAEGETVVRGVEWSDDAVAMLRAIQPISVLRVRGSDVVVSRREPDFFRAFSVGESGFTLRTAVALYAGVPGVTAVYFGGTLRGRPIDDLIAVLRKLTEVVKLPGAVVIRGRRLGRFRVEVRADVSSQYISGLMFLAAAGEGGVITPVGERKSWSFVEATADVLRLFGAKVELGDGVAVDGGLRSPGEVDVPGDFSLASYLAVAAVATGGEVELTGRLTKLDATLVDIFRAMGADVSYDGHVVKARGAFTKGVEVDLGGNPDLVMPVALAAAVVDDVSTIRGVEHLRFKESDRIATVADILERLGVEVQYRDGALHIRGPPRRRGVEFKTHGDHRIGLMALAASRIVGGCVDDIGPVAKSWPSAVLYFAAGEINK
ncbi:3-phosphoshikimate 1-carboxyvinyltransferase [Pyrobaculum ferrireducens]|uniref:3-phosphoshikimate 1-carboxyvinyltransferase n=1 Tax=Pyrobaculum ferrireducens TaxID=1104324 RepID=G7VEM0_9CREN|nr:3-phosphoshikimate 1-carboxyvinyltransferase [Pyrobaculum ferrireducens]AET31644.1 3-phosphoshikimate 1-carboxyvinyltransferase [Pyrobaculum ferrireducens]